MKASLSNTSQRKTHTNTTDIVKSYLREIERFPLLEPYEEVSLSQKVQAMMPLLEAKEALEKEVGYAPSDYDWALRVNLTPEKLKKIVVEGKKAKQTMIERNLRLVVSVAKKYTNRDLNLLDLIQEGSLGLERAVEKFDPQKGYKFSTYGYWWIRQGITRAIATQARTIRLPIHVTEKLNKIKRSQRELSQLLGRAPNMQDVADHLELPLEDVKNSLQLAFRPASLDVPIGDETGSLLKDLLEDQSESPEESLNHQLLTQNLQGLLATLTPQQKSVIELRFGLGGSNPCTLEAAGQQMGISRERVRQIQRDALKRLKLKKDCLSDFMVS